MPKLGRRNEYAAPAPFGTNDTPTFKPRIVGGKIVNIAEDSINSNLETENWQTISDKPTNVDPRALIDFTRRYNQPYQDPFHNQNEVVIRPRNIPKRPDSKDISGRYPSLAPIDGNRIKNQQLSTVFEPEAWTRTYHDRANSPPFQFSTTHKSKSNNHSPDLQNGYPASPVDYTYQVHASPGTREMFETDKMFKARLMSMIPKGMFLPETPIVLSQKDEIRLLSILTSELFYSDPLKLRDVYLDISNRVDKQLSGYCQYHDLYHTLTRVSFQFSPDLLQLVAALFVSNHRNQRDVNYEKFLSFIGVALKNKNKISPPHSTLQHQYYRNGQEARKHSPVRHRPGSPYFGDGGEIKLLRMIEEQLYENEYILDLERLVTSFQIEDRDMRGTLSANQIKNIFFQYGVPIQESLIANLLLRCQEGSGEQYNWWVLVRLLERLQPIKRGLPMPLNKRPMLYARSLPSLRNSWPKIDVGPHESTSPASWNRDMQISHRDEVSDRNKQMHSRMDHRLRESGRIEVKNSIQPHKKDEASWFKSFMQFANALYKQDERFEGRLPYRDVVEWTNIYNKTFDLHIPDRDISTALSQSTKRGHVDIHKFLSLLKK